MSDEFVQATREFANKLLADLNRLDEHGRRLDERLGAMQQVLETRAAAREHMAAESQSRVFQAQRNYYVAVAAMVQEFGAETVIEWRRAQASKDGDGRETVEQCVLLAQAIGFGLTAGEYQETTDLAAWLSRHTERAQEP